MNRLFPGLCIGLLFLGGCVHTTKSESIQHYALTEPARATTREHHAATQSRKILQIARISVPPWLAGTGMYYRLDYRNDSRLATYTRSDWIAPPATMLAPAIRGTITSRGSWQAVIGANSPAIADASVHLHLNDFSQSFPQPNHSVGSLDATATLIDNHSGQVLAQKHFHLQVPAPSADASGGVKALSRASRQFAAQLQHWLSVTSRSARKSD